MEGEPAGGRAKEEEVEESGGGRVTTQSLSRGGSQGSEECLEFGWEEAPASLQRNPATKKGWTSKVVLPPFRMMSLSFTLHSFLSL